MKHIITTLLVLALFAGSKAYAYDFGPFSIRGFALGTLSYASEQCPDCQLHEDEDRQKLWADEIDGTREFGSESGTFSLFQPYLELRPYSLGKGFKVSAMLSQRWRDGKVDIGYDIWYERNATLSHEYYGSLQYGGFPTRGWAIADYPYGSFIGLADAWGSSGSGYGLLTNALRYSSPPFSIFKGDLRLEATFDPGNSDYVGDQKFWEYYLQFVRGKLVLDFVHQNTKNGRPGSWTHGPFQGLTDESKYRAVYDSDQELPENEQRIWLFMARYSFLNKYEIQGGYRRNYWSGADAVIVDYNDDGDALWNNMFNVDWNGELNGVNNPGYPARSRDFMLGGRYFYTGEIILAAGAVYLGEADTENPSERGQSNTATLGNIGVSHIGLFPGLQVSVGASMVQYKHKGLAPLSMPGHAAFSGTDSRVNKSGGAIGITAQYNF